MNTTLASLNNLRMLVVQQQSLLDSIRIAIDNLTMEVVAVFPDMGYNVKSSSVKDDSQTFPPNVTSRRDRIRLLLKQANTIGMTAAEVKAAIKLRGGDAKNVDQQLVSLERAGEITSSKRIGERKRYFIQ